MNRFRPLVLVAALTWAAPVLLAACSDDEPAATAASGEEISFLETMFAHHAQAVQLGLHTARHGDDETVRDLALQIAVSQAHEQGEIQAFLVDRGKTAAAPADDGEDRHGSAPGMIPAADLAAALALDGPALDRRFVALMVEHHRGAVEVVDQVLAGDDLSPAVRDLAQRIAGDQQREITELELLGA